jgi:hypothetical protein
MQTALVQIDNEPSPIHQISVYRFFDALREAFICWQKIRSNLQILQVEQLEGKNSCEFETNRGNTGNLEITDQIEIENSRHARKQ